MWRQCAHSAVLPGEPLCSRSERSTPPCMQGHGRCDETLQDYISKSVSYISENLSVQILFIPGTGGSLLLLNERSEKRFLSSSKHVELVEMLSVTFLTKMHLPNNSFFQYDYIFVLISMCCFAKAHWTFFLCLIPYTFSKTQRHYYLS